MEKTINLTSADYVVGNTDGYGGWTSQSNRIRPLNYISVTENTPCTISFAGANGASLQAVISCFNSSSRDFREFYWLDSPATVTLPTGTVKIAVIFRKSSNEDLQPSDLNGVSVTIYVESIWLIQNNQLTNSEFIDMPSKPFVGDSPLSMWRVQDGVLQTGLSLPCEALGAFANATQLKRVEIPRSVKTIGAEAFRNTLLTSVTIASDCTYSSTSFPEGCVINFYPD